MKKNKTLDIKRLISRGASVALATALIAGGLTACDEETPANINEETTPIVDTITKAPTEEATTDITTEEPSTEATTEPTAPDNPMIGNEKYEKVMAMLLEKNEAYKNGLHSIGLQVYSTGRLQINYYFDAEKSRGHYRNLQIDNKYLDIISNIAGDKLTTTFNEQSGITLHTLNINNELTKEQLDSLFSTLFSIEFEKEQTLQ